MLDDPYLGKSLSDFVRVKSNISQAVYFNISTIHGKICTELPLHLYSLEVWNVIFPKVGIGNLATYHWTIFPPKTYEEYNYESTTVDISIAIDDRGTSVQFQLGWWGSIIFLPKRPATGQLNRAFIATLLVTLTLLENRQDFWELCTQTTKSLFTCKLKKSTPAKCQYFHLVLAGTEMGHR